MPTGIQILVPIGSDQGIITNAFLHINSARIYPTGQPTNFEVYAYPSLISFQTNPSNTLVIKALPPVITFPPLLITSFDNVPDVGQFIYNQMLALVISAVGPGNAIILP